MTLASLFALILQVHDMVSGHELAMPPDPDSLFNHHLAGALVILLGAISYLEQTTELADKKWTKYLWPMPLLVLGVFLMIWSDNPQFWPFNLHRWMRTEIAAQHKIFALVTILLGLIELFRRTGRLKSLAWRQILNLLMLGAGVFLFFHKGHHAHVVHIQHMWMGTWATAAALTKIVADLRGRVSWLSLYAVPVLLIALGLQLALYVE